MSSMTTSSRRAVLALAAGALLTTGGAVAALSPLSAGASSHREAPLIAGAPRYDNTDTYAFVSPDKADTVTLIANWLPFEEPAGGPNFYAFATDARYDINIDNDGDAKPDIIYRWTFTDSYRNQNTFLYNTGVVTSLGDPDLNFRQSYRLQVFKQGGGWTTLGSGKPVAPSHVGDASMPNYGALRDAAVVDLGNGVVSFAGQADDPFFLDLRVFDLLYGADLSEIGNDTLNTYNVNVVALQVPKSKLVDDDAVIGIWSTTSRKGADGDFRQVSRLGMPLVNEVIIPVKDKNRFNASKPKDDAQFLSYVTDPEVPKLIQAIYGIPAPATPRNDLVQVFLTGVPGLNQPDNVTPSEQLRLNTAIAPSSDPKRLGVLEGDNAGFPNGRRLADDVVDIALQVVEGELVGSPNDLGDGVDVNDKPFGTTFPYVALPHSGSVERSLASSGATLLTGGRGGYEPRLPGGVPVVPMAVTGLGVLLLLGSAWSLRRNHRLVAA